MRSTSKTRRPPAKRRRWRSIIFVIAGVFVIGFGALWLMHLIVKPKPHRKLLQSALAEDFGGDEKAIVVNVPARSGRYPGAVLAVSSLGSGLLLRKMDRPETAPSPSGSVRGAEVSKTSTVWQLAGRVFGGRVEGTSNATVEVDLQDIRIFEKEASQLAVDLRGDEGVTRARATGQPVVVITKAYEAVPLLTVRQRSDAKSEDWAKLKSELTKAKGELQADNSVVFRSAAPQVVAYETSEAKFIADNFGGGQPNVQLKRRLASEPATAPRPQEFGGEATGGNVAFAVFASPSYVNANFGDLPAATSSIELVSDLFTAAGAKSLDTGLDPSARLTTTDFAAARSRIVAAVRNRKPRAFVFYYAGHAVSGAAGAQYLVMGDYQGKLSDDLKQTSPSMATPAPDQPSAGSNIHDIGRALAAAAQESAGSKPGLVSVADIYRELAETSVPFAVLIDGCYEAEVLNAMRNELRLTAWGDYYGADNGGPQQIQQYHQELQAYGQAPYLRSANPVIFSARPGTVAVVMKNPFYDGDLVPGVAPLAAKLAGSYLYAIENRDDLPLGIWLRRITDFAGTGEVDVKGSISWSNFEALRPIGMVRFGSQAGHDQP